MTFKKTRYLLLFTLLFFTSCHLIRSMVYLRPDHRDMRIFPKNELSGSQEIFEWQYAENQIDAKKIIIRYKNGDKGNLDSLLNTSFTDAMLIIKKGEIVFEKYYNNYDVNQGHSSFSISKGMLATMVGIALDENLIHSLNEPITKYIPELLNNSPEFGRITIGNLLDMKSGIKIKGKNANPFGDLAKTYYGNNFNRFLKSVEIDTLPNYIFQYNQTDPELLSLILTRATGKSLSEFFNEKIWSQIGAHPAYWSTYRKDYLEKGFCCFSAMVQDYAKFAQLYLQKGKWNGKQLIPKQWVDLTTNKTVDKNAKADFDFNKFWWPANDGANDFTSQGYNNQFIYINPDKELIILRFGQKEKVDVAWEKMMRVIASQI